MDARGDDAANCKHGYGVMHRHNIVRNTHARHAFRAGGLQCDREVPLHISRTAYRPADLLVQPAPPPPGSIPDWPTAYDVTVRNPYTAALLHRATLSIAGAAVAAHTTKLRAHERTLRAVLHFDSTAPLPCLDYHFVPLDFGTLSTWSARTTAVLESIAPRIATGTGTTFGIAKLRLSQRISYAIRSSVASATLARMPYHGSALSTTTPV